VKLATFFGSSGYLFGEALESLMGDMKCYELIVAQNFSFLDWKLTGFNIYSWIDTNQ